MIFPGIGPESSSGLGIWTRRGRSIHSMGLTQVAPQQWEDFDPMDIRREAAMFYGLFLRGHDADELRQDIEIPKEIFDRWLNHPHYDGDFRESVKRIYYFRKKVLAVFDELVDRERIKARLQ
jgi:hypothetical protein